MNEDAIRSRAFAMPLTSPAYPIGPYRFVNREYLIITYRTDAEKLRGDRARTSAADALPAAASIEAAGADGNEAIEARFGTVLGERCRRGAISARWATSEAAAAIRHDTIANRNAAWSPLTIRFSSLRGSPTIAVVGSKRRASSTAATIGIPSCVSPARVESTIATVGSGA